MAMFFAILLMGSAICIGGMTIDDKRLVNRFDNELKQDYRWANSRNSQSIKTHSQAGSLWSLCVLKNGPAMCEVIFRSLIQAEQLIPARASKHNPKWCLPGFPCPRSRPNYQDPGWKRSRPSRFELCNGIPNKLTCLIQALLPIPFDGLQEGKSMSKQYFDYNMVINEFWRKCELSEDSADMMLCLKNIMRQNSFPNQRKMNPEMKRANLGTKLLQMARFLCPPNTFQQECMERLDFFTSSMLPQMRCDSVNPEHCFIPQTIEKPEEIVNGAVKRGETLCPQGQNSLDCFNHFFRMHAENLSSAPLQIIGKRA